MSLEEFLVASLLAVGFIFMMMLLLTALYYWWSHYDPPDELCPHGREWDRCPDCKP